MKKTKIICSIGPASSKNEVMEKMVLNGMNCARINLSHSNEHQILDIIESVRSVRQSTGQPIAIMYDTKGPEFRTLEFYNGGISIKQGDVIRMVKNTVVGNYSEFSVNHPEAIDYINVGNHVLIDNALLDFEVIEKDDSSVTLLAKNDGEVKNHKSINVPGISLNLNFMSETDRNDIYFAATHSCDYLALSFVNKKEDVEEVRQIIADAGGDARIISKIENQIGVSNLDEIIEASDGIMIARGDLGVELPMEQLPVLQKTIIRKCREAGKFAIVATEMLASMYDNPRPTRAEVSDVANAVIDGTDCVMLSGETTVGKYPIESVECMARICEYVESTIDYTKHPKYQRNNDISDTIAKLISNCTEYDDIKLIVTPTISGYTTRKVSNLRPNCIILALCPTSHVAEQLSLNFGVYPIIIGENFESLEELIEQSKFHACNTFKLVQNDQIVVTGGYPFGRTKNTNFLRIVEI